MALILSSWRLRIASHRRHLTWWLIVWTVESTFFLSSMSSVPVLHVDVAVPAAELLALSQYVTTEQEYWGRASLIYMNKQGIAADDVADSLRILQLDNLLLQFCLLLVKWAQMCSIKHWTSAEDAVTEIKGWRTTRYFLQSVELLQWDNFTFKSFTHAVMLVYRTEY